MTRPPAARRAANIALRRKAESPWRVLRRGTLTPQKEKLNNRRTPKLRVGKRCGAVRALSISTGLPLPNMTPYYNYRGASVRLVAGRHNGFPQIMIE